MYIEQLYTGCLSEAAYYIESEGEAAIVDPMREVEPYLQMAKDRGATIKYALETHFHADFVSGHLDLARKTGAQIVYGPGAKAGFDIHTAKDGEELKVGKLKIKVLHTPGHTLESSCYLLINEYGKPVACFTGDTLFVGEVGRPDLAVKSDLSKEDLAGMLYDSLHKKILTLPDDVIVYPGHGAGSACGKNIGMEAFSTIGDQKKYNYALQPMTRDEFVAQVTAELPTPPKYFFMDARINKEGYTPLEETMQKNARPLNVEAFDQAMQAGVVVLDTRDGKAFTQASIPGSLNIGLDGQYAVWVGTLLDATSPILLVTEPEHEQEAVLRLARVGYENVYGYLAGGIAAWEKSGKAVRRIQDIDAATFAKNYTGKENILDVRNPAEQEAAVLPNATLIPLPELENRLAELDKSEHYYIHCAGGYRSVIAAALLKNAGFDHVTNIQGGFSALKQQHLPFVKPAETIIQ